MRFVLASESARRVDLLRTAGYDFETRKSGFPEVTLEDPEETVEANARGKALAVAESTPAASSSRRTRSSTCPRRGNAFSARQERRGGATMLLLLRGRAHEVYSGVAVARGEEMAMRHAVTTVRMRMFGEEELEAYVGLGEGVGKAGGYAIQGRAGRSSSGSGGTTPTWSGCPSRSRPGC